MLCCVPARQTPGAWRAFTGIDDSAGTTVPLSARSRAVLNHVRPPRPTKPTRPPAATYDRDRERGSVALLPVR